MALTAVQVYKYLPKTNCRECGVPTCLAFAMQLVQKRAALDKCPHVTAEAKTALEGASAPPIRLVTIGAGEAKVEIGNETVLFRHEESFYHPPAVAVRVSDALDEAALDARLAAIGKLHFVRVGLEIKVDAVALSDDANSPDAFRRAAQRAAEALALPLVLVAEKTESLAAALEVCAARRPLLHAATPENLNEIAALAKQHHCPLAVRAGLSGDHADLEKAAELTQKLVAAGVEELVVDVTGKNLGATVQALTQARRFALRKSFRALGYPTIAFTTSRDRYGEPAEASACVAKYAGVVVMDALEAWQVLPVLTTRQNIYTDPRKPIQVEPGLYSVGSVTKDSPLLITTNFSLTYYTVEGEVEASRVPAHIGVIDTEGTSVLTAWASEKLTPEKVAALLGSDAVKAKVAHQRVIIPGYVAVMSGKLEDASGWKVVVGPREASGIPRFLKEFGSLP